MTKDVLTVEPSDTIGEAAEKMHDANVGAVVVVEDMVRIIGIVNARSDNRNDIGHVLTHAGGKMRAVVVSRSEDIPGLAEGYDAVGIDEVEFFDPGIVLVIDILVARGTRVVAAGLDQDFRGRPFGAMPELLCRAEILDKLQAVCHRCSGPATMTQRLLDGHPAPPPRGPTAVGALDSDES